MRKSLGVLISMLILTGCILVTGCFALPVEDPIPPPPIARVPQARPLRTQVVRRGDVYRYTNVPAIYVQTREERLSFSLEGLRVQGIYVNAGDYVQEGDILATLYWPEITHQYAAALRREELLMLSISQHDTRRAQAQPGQTFLDGHQAESDRLSRELYLLHMEIDLLREWYNQLYLRASMDGTIVHVTPFSEGMISDTRNVVTIVDMTYSVFEIRSNDVVEHMSIGDIFTLTINQVPHEAIVADPYELGIDRANTRGHEVYLVLLDEEAVLPSRPSATLRFEFDVARDVVYVPVHAVHRTGGREFVYILNEQGIRTIRDVEIGLRSNTAFEIKNGLNEGDVIVLG